MFESNFLIFPENRTLCFISVDHFHIVLDDKMHISAKKCIFSPPTPQNNKLITVSPDCLLRPVYPSNPINPFRLETPKRVIGQH